MNRTITAMYASRTDAETAAAQLRTMGANDVQVVDATSASAPSGSTGEGRGIWEEIKSIFSSDDRDTYSEGVNRGRTLVVVHANEGMADSIVDTLDRTNALDVDEERTQYGQSGWTGGNATGLDMDTTVGMTTTAGLASDTRNAGMTNTGAEQIIPVIEEQISVGKRDTVRGGARVRSYIREIPVSEQVSLREEHVEVERRAVNQPVTGNVGDLLRERSIEVVEHAEEAVVGKRAVVTEEVVVRTGETERVETIQDTVRRTEVEVERLGADNDRALTGDRLAAGDRDPSLR